jgi:hypothetical protein
VFLFLRLKTEEDSFVVAAAVAAIAFDLFRFAARISW